MTTPDNRIEQAAEAAMRGMAEAWVTDDAELFAEVAIGAAKGMHAAGLLRAEPDEVPRTVVQVPDKYLAAKVADACRHVNEVLETESIDELPVASDLNMALMYLRHALKQLSVEGGI